MVAGLSSKLGQTGFARDVLDLINSPGNDAHVLEHARNLVEEKQTDGLGSRFTSMLFGNNLSAITDSIGSASGLRGRTVTSLMSVGAPLLLGSLVQRVRQSSMDPSRLTSFLSDEAAGIWGSLPRGIPRLIGSEVEGVPPVATGVIPERSRGSLWPLLLTGLLLLLGLVWWFSTHRASVEPVKSAATAVVSVVERALPGNVNLRIPAGQMEDRLLAFIQDSTKFPNESTYFDFDRLLFDTNSATLQPASQAQLRDIATILQAYPDVRVKIGGYTDNTGDAAANQLLSQQRADNVKNELIGMGVAADRLEAQGYGEQYPLADNATEEGRQKNRRISLFVTRK
jgi:outer membrane protein OmpA-like peptidoglycan-associated protein